LRFLLIKRGWRALVQTAFAGGLQAAFAAGKGSDQAGSVSSRAFQRAISVIERAQIKERLHQMLEI
jgi:hypothetical protein